MARRQFAAVALLPLHDGPATSDLVERLARALGVHGPVRILSCESVAAAGIPLPERPGAPVSPQTVDWLASEEDRHRWHADFERQAPEKHQRFLEFLCLPDAEMAAIRARARTWRGADSAQR